MVSVEVIIAYSIWTVVTNRKCLDVSLRMWSDASDIVALLRDMDLDIDVMHVKGNLICVDGRNIGRVAERNYISVEHMKMDDDAELRNWLTNTLDIILSKRELIDAIGIGQIEALIWIAIFGCKPVELPRINPNILASCSEYRLKVMCENYTDLDDDGIPTRVCLAASLGAGMHKATSDLVRPTR